MLLDDGTGSLPVNSERESRGAVGNGTTAGVVQVAKGWCCLLWLFSSPCSAWLA